MHRLNFSRPARTVLTCLFLSTISGCASLTAGAKQEVAIQTIYQGGQVFGAQCVVKNDSGTRTLITPSKVMVDKSFGKLDIHCTRPGYPAGRLSLDSRTGGEVFGNILIGGVIGAGIDIGSGSAYEYDASIIVELGKHLPLDNQSTSVDAPLRAHTKGE